MFAAVYFKKVLLSGFEPESKPREGFMIGRYTTGAYEMQNDVPYINLSMFSAAIWMRIGNMKIISNNL